MRDIEFSYDLKHFSLLHICDLLRTIENTHLQLLNRVLFSKIDELRTIEIKLARNERFNLHSIQNNFSKEISFEKIDIKRRQSLYQKNNQFYLKQKRGVIIQLNDIIKTISNFLNKNLTLKESSSGKIALLKLEEFNFENDSTK